MLQAAGSVDKPFGYAGAHEFDARPGVVERPRRHRLLRRAIA